MVEAAGKGDVAGPQTRDPREEADKNSGAAAWADWWKRVAALPGRFVPVESRLDKLMQFAEAQVAGDVTDSNDVVIEKSVDAARELSEGLMEVEQEMQGLQAAIQALANEAQELG